MIAVLRRLLARLGAAANRIARTQDREPGHWHPTRNDIAFRRHCTQALDLIKENANGHRY